MEKFTPLGIKIPKFQVGTYKNEIQLQYFNPSYQEFLDQMKKDNSKMIEFNKNGSKIHIKKENRGKFTASAKAAGQSVQEHAKSVLNDPNATPLQKKRANFARNSRLWGKKEKGGQINYINNVIGFKLWGK